MSLQRRSNKLARGQKKKCCRAWTPPHSNATSALRSGLSAAPIAKSWLGLAVKPRPTPRTKKPSRANRGRAPTGLNLWLRPQDSSRWQKSLQQLNVSSAMQCRGQTCGKRNAGREERPCSAQTSCAEYWNSSKKTAAVQKTKTDKCLARKIWLRSNNTKPTSRSKKSARPRFKRPERRPPPRSANGWNPKPKRNRKTNRTPPNCKHW